MPWKDKSKLFREAKGYGLDVAVGRPNATATDTERIIGSVEEVNDGTRVVTIEVNSVFVPLGEDDVGKIEIVIPDGAKK